jgi:hypothetical protein
LFVSFVRVIKCGEEHYDTEEEEDSAQLAATETRGQVTALNRQNGERERRRERERETPGVR